MRIRIYNMMHTQYIYIYVHDYTCSHAFYNTTWPQRSSSKVCSWLKMYPAVVHTDPRAVE